MIESVKDTGSSSSADFTADPVCEFYASHPYPPPVKNLDRARDQWQDLNRHRSEFHLLWPEQPFRADLEILVAGCGTWQAAKYALTHPAASVVGIDLSTTSLEHTDQLKQQYELKNLETRQLPIEDVGSLGRSFDLIVCTGVLHHLTDPDAGLRALGSVLKPEGAIYLMLYAPYGRAGVYMLQEYCRRLGIGTSEREINDLVSMLKSLSENHPFVPTLRGSRESLDADALADALLNPRERSYSVPQLFDFIERNGLSFERWHWQAPYLPQCGAISATPHANRLVARSERERSALMELWRGTMTAHSVIVHRDGPPQSARVCFDDEHWKSYMPIRLPWTMCVLERLPKGTAGVLLNRSHQFHDLILAIDANEKELFDLIDGRHSIAEIIDQASSNQSLPRARSFFEKLWWYDQVVFDTSAVN
ncbi:MAG TPA: class I SAM-dependent methyltransferase [Pyrinomonadaceae bacterium]|nr:class I SAM-dependent methyltransferase [Pyrinomonadaceae bacterium]